LPLLTAIISGIAEHPGSQQPNGLQFLIGGGEALVLEERVTALLDHVLQRHEAGLVSIRSGIAIPISSQGSDSRSDDRARPAGGSALGLGTNELRAQGGQDLREDLLARGLGAQEATDHLRLAAPLPAPLGAQDWTGGRRRVSRRDQTARP
jgi:hypothetical protein